MVTRQTSMYYRWHESGDEKSRSNVEMLELLLDYLFSGVDAFNAYLVQSSFSDERKKQAPGDFWSGYILLDGMTSLSQLCSPTSTYQSPMLSVSLM